MTDSQWEKPDCLKDESSDFAQPAQTEVIIIFGCHALNSFHLMYYHLLVADNIKYNIVFLCRAPPAVPGWKVSVLMVIYITTTQTQEVESLLLNCY